MRGRQMPLAPPAPICPSTCSEGAPHGSWAHRYTAQRLPLLLGAAVWISSGPQGMSASHTGNLQVTLLQEKMCPPPPLPIFFADGDVKVMAGGGQSLCTMKQVAYQ